MDRKEVYYMKKSDIESCFRAVQAEILQVDAKISINTAFEEFAEAIQPGDNKNIICQ
jgi:hypothetical protein